MLFGAFCMRGAGCILNDYADRKIDKFVERTKTRPLASGELTEKDAKKSLFLHLLGAVSTLPFLVDFTTQNYTCFWLAVASLPLVAAYPYSKRYTNCPQVVLGATFSWGVFMGLAAVDPSNLFGNNLPIAISAYFSCILWTLYYDTIYAFQDVVDDRTMGVKSFALTLLDQKNQENIFGQINQNDTKLKHDNLSQAEISDKINQANKILRNIGISSSLLMSLAMHLAEFDPVLIGIWSVGSVGSVVKTTRTNWMVDPKVCWEAFNNEKRKGFLLVLLMMLGPTVLGDQGTDRRNDKSI